VFQTIIFHGIEIILSNPVHLADGQSL